MSEDLRVMACQYLDGTNIASPGARAYLIAGGNNGDGGERRLFYVRSRSGRWIEKWEAISKLHNFRMKTIPPEHPLHEQLRSRAAAQAVVGQKFLLGESEDDNRPT